MRKRLAEKAKDGSLKTNGEPKLVPKKRGRWDQTDDAPAAKKVSGTAATPTSWDNADVCLLLTIKSKFKVLISFSLLLLTEREREKEVFWMRMICFRQFYIFIYK